MNAPLERRADRVLIVEDEALIALDLERALRSAGIEVVGIRDDVPSAREAVHSTAPDLVLLDIHLQGPEDGVVLAHELRDSDVAVVFLTDFGDDATLRRAGDAHPHGFLVKPVDPRSLAAMVLVALRRKRAERHSWWLERAVEAAQVAVMIVDGGPAPEVIHVNEGFRRLAAIEPGVPVHELSPCLLASDHDGPELSRMRDAIASGCSYAEIVPCRDRLGRRFFSHVSVAPLGVLRGVPRVAIVHVDVTSRISSEAALADNQRLVLVGRLAAGLAHDLNNLLSVMVSFAELTSMALEAEGERWCEPVQDLKQVVDAGQRAGLLSRRLLSLARRRPESAPEELELGFAVMTSLRLFEQACGSDVTLDVDPGPGRLFVSVDPVDLQQVLLNLVTNARDAGASHVRLAVVERPGSDDADRRDLVGLRVEDDGVGMSADVAARAFDPLFSTKGDAGTGLGLYNAQTVLQRAGGDICVDSRPGEGTRVELWLPPLSVVEGGKPPRDEAPRIEGVRCFLVEGDPAVRATMARILRGAGAVVEPLAKGAATPRLGRHEVLVCDALAVERRDAFERCSLEERRRWCFVAMGSSHVPTSSGWGALPLLKPFSSAPLIRRIARVVESDGLRPARVAIRQPTPYPEPRPVRASLRERARPLVAARDPRRVLGVLTAELVELLRGAAGPSEPDLVDWMASTTLPLWVEMPPDDAGTTERAPFAARLVLVADASRLVSEAARIADLRRIGYRVALVGQAALTDVAVALEHEPDYFVLPREFTRGVVGSAGWADLSAQTVAALRRRGIDVIGREVCHETEASALADVGCDLLEGPRFAARIEEV